MPEGHSVHRIANQFSHDFLGKEVEASSPQGRFAAGAHRISGRTMTGSLAVGKHLFLEFDEGENVHVHLGLYGSWTFAGNITRDAASTASGGRIGQTNQRGIPIDQTDRDQPERDPLGRDKLQVAPRATRLRVAEEEQVQPEDEPFPAPPVGAVRVRLLTEDTVADLRGPTACDVLTDEEMQAIIARLGPDPLVDRGRKGEERFVQAVHKKRTPIGLLLMDQAVVSGIGNIYRAELLFRARLDPHTPGRDIPEELLRALWKDWAKLLKSGVELGVMMTRAGLSKSQYAVALARRDERHWVYHREGLPCRVCGTPIAMEVAAGRKLYWCPTDQV
jgi:endonuclease-8